MHNKLLYFWLNNLKEKAPHEYPYIIQFINEYNEKNNISKRYE